MRKSESVMSYSDSYKLSYSDLFRVSIDPRVKPEGDRKESVPEGDERRKNVPEGDERWKNMPEGNGIINMYRDDNFYKVMSRFGTNRHGIFELMKKKIGSSLDVFWRKRGMTMLMWILVSSTSIAQAECVSLPDCASIGYTETSCEGGFVRCPFDISKLYCIPCDTKYKYTCSGTGQIGSGESCNGKYVSCECASGYEWNSANESCNATAQNCPVGYIYYTDKTCSSSYNSSKTVAGIVIKDNELVMSEPIHIPWGGQGTDISGLDNINNKFVAQTDMNGESYTSIIVSVHRELGLNSSGSVAIYCNSYTGGISGTSGKWYLPAAGELYTYLYGNYSTINPVATTLNWSYFNGWYWSSTEINSTDVWKVLAMDGNMDLVGYKDRKQRACCFFAL